MFYREMRSRNLCCRSSCSRIVIVLLPLIAFHLFACGGKEQSGLGLIRLTEPDRIESVESEHMDLLNNDYDVLEEETAITGSDWRSQWHPF